MTERVDGGTSYAAEWATSLYPTSARLGRRQPADGRAAPASTSRHGNNVWVIGDDAGCVIIDAPHEAAAIHAVVAGRRVVGILLSHGQNDRVTAVSDLVAATGAPPSLHPDDRVV